MLSLIGSPTAARAGAMSLISGVELVALPVHVPVPVVSVLPTSGVPETVGLAIFCGGAALAAVPGNPITLRTAEVAATATATAPSSALLTMLDTSTCIGARP